MIKEQNSVPTAILEISAKNKLGSLFFARLFVPERHKVAVMAERNLIFRSPVRREKRSGMGSIMEKITFHLPRYQEIPAVGLYLEQIVKYVNENLEPLGLCVTPNMISNYVKKGYISRPNRKQYDRDQIAYILFIVIAKQVLSMENIEALFALQKTAYGVSDAYDFFCSELEEMVWKVFAGEAEEVSRVRQMPEEKRTLTSVVIAISHVLYLDAFFKGQGRESDCKTDVFVVK